MIVFIHAPDFDRTRDRLIKAQPDIRPLVVAPDGRQLLNGREVAPNTVEPQAVWITRSVFDDGPTELFLEKAMFGPAVHWVQTFNAGLDTSFRKMQAYGINFSEAARAMAARIGVDRSVFQVMLDNGRRLCNSNAMAIPIAEYVMGQVAAEWYLIAAQRAAQQGRQWTLTPFRELAGSRWMIIGYGNNGRQIAQRAKAFGAHVTGVRRTPAPDAHADDVLTLPDGLARLGQMDVVILACPLNEQTANLADEAFFEAMRPGGLLVNIARGGLIEEAALFAGLAKNRPRIAILDAFRTEPLPETDPLWTHPQIRITAHCSWAGDGVVARNDDLFLENLGRFHNGVPLINEVRTSDF